MRSLRNIILSIAVFSMIISLSGSVFAEMRNKVYNKSDSNKGDDTITVN